jgi:hypothetical protein
MVRTGRCMVPGCPNKFDLPHHKRTMSYFQIPDPKDNPVKQKLSQKWLKFCDLSMTGFIFGNKTKIICEKHFMPEDLEDLETKKHRINKSGYLSKRVKKGAVPKIFDVRDAPPSSAELEPASPESHDEGHKENNRSREVIVEPPNDDECRYVNDFVPELLDKPPTDERKKAADLARWPPDLNVSVSDLNSILMCRICKGYFHNATTITECLHTFCKGCLVVHFYRSLNCPTCNILVHPSDPFVNIKSDAILQDLVYKIFPQRLQHDKKDEADFYVSRGLNPPNLISEKVLSSQSQDTKKVKMISLRLDYAGTTPSLPRHQPLEKNFIRVPNNVTIGMIVKFLHIKMQLPVGSQAALFINCFMLNESLTVSRLEEIFGEQVHEQCGDLIFLQFGVIPKADYFDKGLLVSTKYL